MGLVCWEGYLVVYFIGLFYRCYLDVFVNVCECKVLMVFYLNLEWCFGDGGELRLWMIFVL